MGDILHALPAVSALRLRHPEWVIGWAVEPQWQALLRADSGGNSADTARGPGQPLVDRIHLVPAKSWARQPWHGATFASIARVRRELRDAGYDAVVDLQGAVRSAIVGRWARPRRLVGEAAPREPMARWLFGERIRTTGVHVIEQAAEVLRALGGDALPLGLPMLPVDGAGARWCRAAGVNEEVEPFVLLHPGAGWGAKRWPVERYAEAGAAVAGQTGFRFVINVAPSEMPLGEKLHRQLEARGVAALLLAPTVGQLVELTRRAALAVGGDTGPLHLAAALGKPTVAIFGPTDPVRNGPFHGHFHVLRDPGSRRDHTRRADPEAGLLRIAPEAVAEAAVHLLATARVPATVHGERP